MLQHEAGRPDAGRSRLDRHRVGVEDLGAIGDPGLGEDQALGAVMSSGEGLSGDVRPVPDPRHLAVRQVDRVVDVAHRVGVREPDGKLDAVGEVARQVAGVGSGPDAASVDHGDAQSAGSTTRVPTIPASACPSTVQRTWYVPGSLMTKRTVCVWPGRAPASTFATPSTSQSWKTGSSLWKATTTVSPARMRTWFGVNATSLAATETCTADASIARSRATTPVTAAIEAIPMAPRNQASRTRRTARWRPTSWSASGRAS